MPSAVYLPSVTGTGSSHYVSSVKGAVRCKERQKYCLTFLVAVHNWVLLKNKTMEDKNNKIIIVIKRFKSYKLK